MKKMMTKSSTLVVIAMVVLAILEVAVGQQAKIISHHSDPTSIFFTNHFTPDYTKVVANSYKSGACQIQLFDIQSNSSEQVFTCEAANITQGLFTLELSKSQYFAIANANISIVFNTTVQVYSVHSKPGSAPLWSVNFTPYYLANMKISANGQVIVVSITTPDERLMVMWLNAANGKQLGFWIADDDFIPTTESHLNEDGTIFVVYGRTNSEVYVLDISSNSGSVLLHLKFNGFANFALSPSGRSFMYANGTALNLFTYSSAHHPMVLSWTGNNRDRFYTQTLSLTDSHVAVGSYNFNTAQSGITLFGFHQSTPLWQYYSKPTQGRYVNLPRQIKFSADGKMIASALAGDENRINPQLIIFSVETGLVWNYTTPGPMYSVDVIEQPSGGYLAVACGAHGYGVSGGDLYVYQFQKFLTED